MGNNVLQLTAWNGKAISTCLRDCFVHQRLAILYRDTSQAEGISIFTEGDTLEELKDNIKRAVRVHLADGEYKKYGLFSENPKISLAYNYEEPLV